MAEVVLFHHVHGLTAGVRAFADEIRAAGHAVHTPDLYDGNVFDNLEDGQAYARKVGFGTLIGLGAAAADQLPAGAVYGGFSLGVLPAQMLAQTRPAGGALFYHSAIPPAEFGAWPAGLPVHIHAMDNDPFFVGEDNDAARAIVDVATDGELFLYPGEQHLFTDSSLPAYDADASALVMSRTLAFLDRG